MSAHGLDEKLEDLKGRLKEAQKQLEDTKNHHKTLHKALEEARAKRNEKCLQLTTQTEGESVDLEKLITEIEELKAKQSDIREQIKMYTAPMDLQNDPVYLNYMNNLNSQEEAACPIPSSDYSLATETEANERLTQLLQAIMDLKQENSVLRQKLDQVKNKGCQQSSAE